MASPIGMEGGSKYTRAMLMCYVFHADIWPLDTTRAESNRHVEDNVYIRMLKGVGWMKLSFYVVHASCILRVTVCDVTVERRCDIAREANEDI